MLLRWSQGPEPVTSKSLQDSVGCNYRTVAAALRRLGKSLKRHSDRRVGLEYFPRDEWAKILATSERARSTLRYTAHSGRPRSLDSLTQRLKALGRTDIAIGGVLGATYHDPELDLVGVPRLDITVHAPHDRADIYFLRDLDPALKEVRAPDTQAHVVIHFLRRREPFFVKGREGLQLADAIECLLDLHEARLETQALGFVKALSDRRKSFESTH
jgi:hypothetical protein